MKIHIPNSAFIGNIESFTNGFDPLDEYKLEVTSNPSWISIHPVVISMVIALAEEVSKNGGCISVEDLKAKSLPYLLRMGLVDAIKPLHKYQIDEHESAGRFIKARIIKTSEELNHFITDMVPMLHTTPEQAFPIKYVMSELVRNVLEHSVSGVGAIVSAQYFKKTNRISIGVADRGIGIKASITRSYPCSSHLDALTLALKPGITGTTRKIGGTEYNAGAGLFFTKSIAKVSRDFFMLYSGDALFKLHKTNPEKTVKLYPDPLDDKAKLESNMPFWKGTVVGIDISMDINHNFQDLLEMIRKAYHLDLKKAARVKYKKPKFV